MTVQASCIAATAGSGIAKSLWTSLVSGLAGTQSTDEWAVLQKVAHGLRRSRYAEFGFSERMVCARRGQRLQRPGASR